VATGIEKGMQSFYQDRARWLLWVPVLLGLGIAVSFSLKWQPGYLWVGGATVIPLFMIGCRLLKADFLILPFIIMEIIVIGFTVPILRQLSVAAPVLQKKHVAELTGIVLQMTAGSKAAKILIGEPQGLKSSVAQVDKIRLTVRTGAKDISPGQTIKIKAVLLPPPPPAYPGAYDFQRDLYFKGIGAVGYAIGRAEIMSPAPEMPDLRMVIANLRYSINQNIIANSPPGSTGFIMAIMTGDRSLLSKQTLAAMRASGLAHLLAISGLHMGMVGGIIFFAIRFAGSLFPYIALHYPLKKWAAIAAIIGVSGYLAVSGLSVSATRSYLMISMIFWAICVDRAALSLRNLAIAATLILLILPETLLSASFQMSFAAVFCLIAVYERYGSSFMMAAGQAGPLKRAGLYLMGVAATSLIASVATAPFAIYHFGNFAVLGLLANLVAVPLMGFWIMPWMLISFVAMPFGWAALPLEMAGVGIDTIENIATRVADLPSASIQVGSFSTALLVMIVVAVLWGFIWRSPVRHAAFGFLLLGIAFQTQYRRPDILFADSGNLYLFVIGQEQYEISSLRRDRFKRNRWQKLYGVKKFSKISAMEEGGAPVACDLLGCVWQRGSRPVSYSRNWMGQGTDCNRAYILLSAAPVLRECPAPTLIIDKFDLWRGGTYAIYLDGKDTIRWENVNSVRGNRPWVPLRYRETYKEKDKR